MKNFYFLLIPMLGLAFAQSTVITLNNPKPVWLSEPVGGDVIDANWSFDGRRFITAGSDGTARVWDTATGKSLLRIDGDRSALSTAVFLNDGKKILTTAHDNIADLNVGTTRIWDISTAKPQSILEDTNSDLAVLSQDNSRFLTGGFTGFKLWNTKTGKLVSQLKDATVTHFAVFAKDDKSFVTANYEKTAQIWNAKTLKPIRRFVGHQGVLNTARFSLDTTRLVTASDDSTVRVWNVKSGKSILILRGETKVSDARFLLKDSRILSRDETGSIKLWDAKTGTQLFEISNSFTKFEVSSDETKLVSTQYNEHSFSLWSLVTGKKILNLNGHTRGVRTARFATDGSKLLSAGFDGTARVWNAKTGQEIRRVEGHIAGLNSVEFSADSKTIYASNYNTLRVFDASTGVQQQRMDFNDSFLLSAHFSSDGSRILILTEIKALLLDANTKRQIMEFAVPNQELIREVQYSFDNTKILTVTGHGVFVWDAKTGKEITGLSLLSDKAWFQFADFSRDDRQIITFSNQGLLQTWDATTGEQQNKLEILGANPLVMKPIILNTDSSRIAFMKIAQFVAIWDLTQQKRVFTLEESDSVIVVSGSQDGLFILGFDYLNRSVKVWDSTTGKLKLQILLNKKIKILNAAFDTDATKIVVTSTYGLQLFQLPK